MATYRIFCYNPTGATISGTEQVGSIAAATGNVSIDPTKQWWNGPDEDVRYIVAYSSLNSERSNGPERVLATNYPCNLGFIGSAAKTDESFLNLAKTISGSSSLASASAAKTWLNTNGYWTSWTSSSFDSDAQAFITAAAITDTTQKNAVNQLVLDLKSYGLWNKHAVIYPFVGGNSNTNRFNLKDPNSYLITFYGGWTHDANGITSNINTYADTGFIPSFGFSSDNNYQYSFYSRTNISSESPEFNVFDVTGCDEFGYLTATNYLVLRRSAVPNSLQYIDVSGGYSTAHFNLSDSQGLFTISRTASNSYYAYRNGNVLGISNTFSSGSGSRPSISLLITGSNDPCNGQSPTGIVRNYAFWSMGDGLNATEAANFYTAVQTFQTTLGRQV